MTLVLDRHYSKVKVLIPYSFINIHASLLQYVLRYFIVLELPIADDKASQESSLFGSRPSPSNVAAVSQLPESFVSNSRLKPQILVDDKSGTAAGPQLNIPVLPTFSLSPQGGTSSNPKTSSLLSGMGDQPLFSTSTKLPSPRAVLFSSPWASPFACGIGSTSSEPPLNPPGSPNWATGALSPPKPTSSQQSTANYGATLEPVVASEVNDFVNNTLVSSSGSHISNEGSSRSSSPLSLGYINARDNRDPNIGGSSDVLSRDTVDDNPIPTPDEVLIPSFTLPVTSPISRSSIFASSNSNPASPEPIPGLDELRLSPLLSQSSWTLPSDATAGTATKPDKSIQIYPSPLASNLQQ